MPFQRVLSIAPGTTRFGFCYFEGTELLDWGLRRSHDERGGRGVRDASAVASLADQYRPGLVVLPVIRERDKRRPTQRRFVEAVRTSLVGGIADVVLCRNEDVWKCFRELMVERKPTRHQIMTRLGLLFPELALLVPRPRRPWQPQGYWTPMFAAAAQAVAVITVES